MSRELLQQCLDLITKLDKDGMVLEAELIFSLREELAKRPLPMSPEHLPQYIATNNIKPTTEGGGGAGGKLAKPEQELVCDKDPSLCGFVLCQLGKVCKHTPINTMPTKIFAPNLEQILNAAGFYRRDAVCCGDYEKCIEPCTPKGEWLAKKELAKEEPLPPVDIGVDVTPEGTHVVACYNRPDAVQEMFYSQFHPLAKPEQEPVAWIGDANYVEGQFVEGRVRRVWWECNTGVGQPLYTAPPRKEWVGLTNNELQEILDCGRGFWTNAAKIEQLLKNKNT